MMLNVINALYKRAYRKVCAFGYRDSIDYELFREASDLLAKHTPTLRAEGRLEEHPWYDHRREFAYV